MLDHIGVAALLILAQFGNRNFCDLAGRQHDIFTGQPAVVG
jgi:hypothetical protein